MVLRWDGITDSMDTEFEQLREMVKTGNPGMLHSMESQKSQT